MLMFVTCAAKFWSSFAAGLVNFGWVVMKLALLDSVRSVVSTETLFVRVHAVRFVVLTVFGGHGNGFVSFS